MNWAGERRRERQRWRWRQPPCEAASLSRLKSSEMIYSGTPLLAARPPPSPGRLTILAGCGARWDSVWGYRMLTKPLRAQRHVDEREWRSRRSPAAAVTAVRMLCTGAAAPMTGCSLASLVVLPRICLVSLQFNSLP